MPPRRSGLFTQHQLQSLIHLVWPASGTSQSLPTLRRYLVLLSIGLLLLTACGDTSTTIVTPPLPTATLRSVTTTTPIPPATGVESMTGTLSAASPTAQTRALPITEESYGAIQGSLSYPSDGVPELDIYAIGVNESAGTFYTMRTTSGDTTFHLTNVEAGDYHLVAYLTDTPNDTFAGGYTEAVACGLLYECTDHSLITVVVAPGETVSEVAISDWYAPPGAFLPRPEHTP